MPHYLAAIRRADGHLVSIIWPAETHAQAVSGALEIKQASFVESPPVAATVWDAVDPSSLCEFRFPALDGSRTAVPLSPMVTLHTITGRTVQLAADAIAEIAEAIWNGEKRTFVTSRYGPPDEQTFVVTDGPDQVRAMRDGIPTGSGRHWARDVFLPVSRCCTLSRAWVCCELEEVIDDWTGYTELADLCLSHGEFGHKLLAYCAEAVQALRSASVMRWQGDIEWGPYLMPFWPAQRASYLENGNAYAVLLKQLDNGTTFLIAPEKLQRGPAGRVVFVSPPA